MEENKFLQEVGEWTKAIIFAFFAALLINVFIFELYTVSGSSMVPTFHNAERVFVLKLPHLLHKEPNYGDIVIIDSRVERLRTLQDEFVDNAIISKFLGKQNQNIWIKRVIGKPGDLLEFKDGRVYRNGKLLEEPYINEKEMDTSASSITVPEKHVFVMGDNRNHSSDSRAIGPVPFENVRGEVMFRFWPFNKFSFF